MSTERPHRSRLLERAWEGLERELDVPPDIEAHILHAVAVAEPGLDEQRLGALWGHSLAMRRLFDQIREVAHSDPSVLITGETGTGKELVARTIHDLSSRATGPFVVVDCSTIIGTLGEALLFGFEKGAFTGAIRRTDGPFHEAHGGTIFLDEIDALSIELQLKLLRVLAEQKVKRLGGRGYREVDVRVIAATHRSLGRDMNEQRFRSDLLVRLSQVRLDLPPLRERREDIPLLIRATCDRIGKFERGAEISDFVVGKLGQHSWPGNVRELIGLVHAAAYLPSSEVAIEALLPPAMSRDTEASSDFLSGRSEAIARFEEEYFARLWTETSGNVSEIARRAGMARHHVRAHLRRLGFFKGKG